MTILYFLWPESQNSISISAVDKTLCVSHRYNTIRAKYTSPAQNGYCVLGVFKFCFSVKTFSVGGKLGRWKWKGRNLFIINISPASGLVQNLPRVILARDVY